MTQKAYLIKCARCGYEWAYRPRRRRQLKRINCPDCGYSNKVKKEDKNE